MDDKIVLMQIRENCRASFQPGVKVEPHQHHHHRHHHRHHHDRRRRCRRRRR